MIADIFYPIFTLTITILACFIRKKKENCSGDLHPNVHQGIALDSIEGGRGGLTARPEPPASIVFGFSRTDAPIFFLYYPLRYHSNNYHSWWHWMQLSLWWRWHHVPLYKNIIIEWPQGKPYVSTLSSTPD